MEPTTALERAEALAKDIRKKKSEATDLVTALKPLDFAEKLRKEISDFADQFERPGYIAQKSI